MIPPRLVQLLSVTAATVAAAAQPPSADGPLTRIVPDLDCGAPSTQDEIVVCGRRDSEAYRIPKQFRDLPTFEDRDASWSTRLKDEGSLRRYSDQMVGPSGYLQYGRQLDCQWRVHMQQLRGERPDCTRRVLPMAPRTP